MAVERLWTNSEVKEAQRSLRRNLNRLKDDQITTDVGMLDLITALYKLTEISVHWAGRALIPEFKKSGNYLKLINGYTDKREQVMLESEDTIASKVKPNSAYVDTMFDLYGVRQNLLRYDFPRKIVSVRNEVVHRRYTFEVLDNDAINLLQSIVGDIKYVFCDVINVITSEEADIIVNAINTVCGNVKSVEDEMAEFERLVREHKI